MFIHCDIIGRSKEAIFETVKMIWDLPATGVERISTYSETACSPDDLLRLFQTKYPDESMELWLMLRSDEEYAHVERHSNGYSMYYDGNDLERFISGISEMPNVREIYFNHMKFKLPLELTRKALSTPVHSIRICLDDKDLQGHDFRSVNIVAKEVSFVVLADCLFPRQLTANLLRQMGRSGQLESMDFAFCWNRRPQNCRRCRDRAYQDY
ncbi:hypothetical protein FisN_14Hu383 [Fistulifera solaris]|uniref:Uncharacterized protein n=1 Tax=Fistulifera solaris TaxID=1519565 RepID=A0A1Z5K4R7_FISSO|nr:hypothetical protein FisN_14Hu383 [Fistulifera solaris]|eukprot:GAX21172.1 hypothetical protein FisN_14Hu383 [Fistulifera solaris]